MENPYQHVVIIGCGLLGASLGMALRRRKLARFVTGVGRKGSRSAETARARGALDHTADDPAAAVRGTGATPPADLVVLCTPVGTFPDLFRAIAPALPDAATVTDVGSTKADVMRWASELLPPSVHFIGSHPMAGSEKNGPEAAKEDLYEGGAGLICAPQNAPPDVVLRIASLWRAVGMRVIHCTASQHDAWVAAVSHLPHALAGTLVKTAADDPPSLETAAGGFIDTSRIASGDVAMWTDIFLTNRDPVVENIDRFMRHLMDFRDAVGRGDAAFIRESLTASKRIRDDFITRRRSQTNAQTPKPGA